MRKLRLIFIPMIISLLAGCDFNLGGKNVDLSFTEGQELSQSVKKGELGDFELLTPTSGAIVTQEPTFSWTASENAHHYTLEVCSSETFDKTTNSYSYNGNATIYCQVNDSYTIMEYSNIVLKFEDDLLISISFHSIENEYSDPDYENKTSTSETNKSFTFSNYGTTSVEHINTN